MPYCQSTLRSKLICSFLSVALLPLLLLAFLNQQVMQQALTNNANQTLFAAASQTALSIDAFISSNLDAVRGEAQLPALPRLLSLPDNQRQKHAVEVEGILHALSRKDTLNILSYALLDLQGLDILDTYTPDIGKYQSNWNDFQPALKTGLPSVSPIRFSSAGNIASLDFGSPVRNASGRILGVLRVRYNAAAIQQLVTQNSNVMGGHETLAILLDENYIRLAQGYAPELIAKSVAPLPSERVRVLQAAARLPKRLVTDVSTNLPAFERGLANVAKSPFFTTPVDATNSLNFAAAVKLKTQPWFVAFIQPQEVFLAPIQAQIRNTLLLAVTIGGAVTIAAVTTAQLFAKPLISLAGTVRQFTAGNLNARTFIQSKDEIGMLAFNFNTMAQQVGKLLQGLEERTHELEVSQHITVAVSELSRAILDPELLLREASALMQSRFGLSYVQIYLLEPTTRQLIWRADSGKRDNFRSPENNCISLDCKSNLLVRAALSEKIWVEDGWLAQVGSEVAVPLLAHGSLIGVLGIQDERPHRFSQTDMETFNTLAGQIAIALENARLFEEIQKAEAQHRDKAEQLEQALHELQRTQTQLIQTEKMSSLGQLVAGIAHEINNPVNFIFGNITPADQYLQDLLNLLQLYQQHDPNPVSAIREYAEAIELDFLVQDFQKILSSMKLGAERIRQIVLSLRNFSRLDEALMKEVDIHEGIDNTLVILQSQLKGKSGHPEIQVIKEYGNLPKVECCAGQLNQVFMNLLVNAIDSLDECNRKRLPDESKQKPSAIWIRTISDGDWVEICIIDNGLGMTPEVQKKLFDPFFTTKSVGKGTGLGLAISYQIVIERHGGQLNCISAPGQGAEFVIKIPIRVQQVV